MRSVKVYIAGRVTGLPRQEAARNFERGTRLLLNNTYNYLNPLDIVPETCDNKEAMRLLIPELLKCDAILLLNDAKFSPGAHLEEQIARYCGLDLYYEDDLS
jgi:hypothetical protein